jgi:hypothetical protein
MAFFVHELWSAAAHLPLLWRTRPLKRSAYNAHRRILPCARARLKRRANTQYSTQKNAAFEPLKDRI